MQQRRLERCMCARPRATSSAMRVRTTHGSSSDARCSASCSVPPTASSMKSASDGHGGKRHRADEALVTAGALHRQQLGAKLEQHLHALRHRRVGRHDQLLDRHHRAGGDTAHAARAKRGAKDRAERAAPNLLLGAADHGVWRRRAAAGVCRRR
jgi:hypothetical protein